MKALQRQLIEKFHVAPEQADKLIREADAKARMKAAIIGSATGEHHVKASEEDLHDPEVWREEIRKRMQALEVLQEGVKGMEMCAKLLKRIIQAEQKLIAGKTTTVNHRGMDWWDFNGSGWAMGGREQFAQVIADIFRNIDEPKIATLIIDKIGFKRAIPIPEDDIPPLAPAGEPSDQKKEREVPAHVAVKAMLVRGAVKSAVTAADNVYYRKKVAELRKSVSALENASPMAMEQAMKSSTSLFKSTVKQVLQSLRDRITKAEDTIKYLKSGQLEKETPPNLTPPSPQHIKDQIAGAEKWIDKNQEHIAKWTPFMTNPQHGNQHQGAGMYLAFVMKGLASFLEKESLAY